MQCWVFTCKLNKRVKDSFHAFMVIRLYGAFTIFFETSRRSVGNVVDIREAALTFPGSFSITLYRLGGPGIPVNLTNLP